MPRISEDAFDDLGMLLRPPKRPGPVKQKTWAPKLNAIQQEIFDCEAKYVLAWGEKYSGKSYGMLHRVVRHCFENKNALALVLTTVRSMSEDGGAWHKLITQIMPDWQEGLGIKWERKTDKQHNEYIWVQNIHGEWSQIKGVSAPHPQQLRERSPGREHSLVFVDELTECATDEYFKAPAAQLGRRPFVDGVHQFLGACNPKGPSHWVYKTWFQDPFNEETGQWDQNYVNIYVPIADNKSANPEYYEGLRSIYRNDPIEAARLIGGEWIDRPSGESLFREIYIVENHVRPLDEAGLPDRNNRLLPAKGHPIIIGCDPGAVHNSFAFLQWLPMDGKMKWVAFDEVVSIRKRINYDDFIPIIMRRVKFWREVAEADAASMAQVWISDSSAFNQYRAAQGSFDVLEIERIYEAARAKYGLEPVKIKSAPKFNGSVIIRVRTLQKLLSQDEFVVSSGCPKIQSMLMQLEAQKQKRDAPFDPDLAMTPARSEHLHVFDSVTYPIITASISPTMLLPGRQEEQRLVSVGNR